MMVITEINALRWLIIQKREKIHLHFFRDGKGRGTAPVRQSHFH